MAYVIPDPLPWTALASPLAAAEDALARLDERLGSSPIREGWISRTHVMDACASLGLQGALVHLEDLVLHDAGMDQRAPRADPGPHRAPDAASDRGRRAWLGHECVRASPP